MQKVTNAVRRFLARLWAAYVASYEFEAQHQHWTWE
jgi:hypothetical protein